MTGAKIMMIAGDILISPAQKTRWTGPRIKADRPPVTGEEHGGIHAYRTLRAAVAAVASAEHRRDVPDTTQRSYAIVRPDGETVVGEHGWTAEAATIVRVFLPPALYTEYARGLYDRYRVPVNVLPRNLQTPTPPQRTYMHQNQCPTPGRTPAGEVWLRLRYPCARLERNHAGRLRMRLSERNWVAGAMVPYDPAWAACQRDLDTLRQQREPKEREERWQQERRARAEREAARQREIAADHARALEILRPYLPIPTVRVSSAQARGAAKQYAYWGAVRYEIRETADGRAVSNIPLERASSDRRSERLAGQDADGIAGREGRIVWQRIGRLSATLAREIVADLEAAHAA